MSIVKKPTILYISPDYSMGGSAQSLYNLIDSVKEHVYPIVLLSSKGIGYDYCINHGIECIVHPYMLLHLQQKSIKELLTHPWRLPWIKYVRNELTCLFFVKRYFRGRKVDIVHSNVGPLSLGFSLAKLLHAKHIWHVRELSDTFEIFRGFDRLKEQIGKADARIAISNAVKERWQMPEQNTWVINDAIRSQSDVCYEPMKEKYLLFCSAIIMEDKGARKVITSFAKSGVYKDGYKLKYVGKCAEGYKESLLQTARDNGVEKYIEFVGTQKDVKPWFTHATAYIMASESEGLGRVSGEAMFYGCPVIAHATGGIVDIVKHKETGYLYDTIDECAELMKYVCVEPQEALIIRAQKFAEENLSQEVYGPKIMEVYNTILKQ